MRLPAGTASGYSENAPESDRVTAVLMILAVESGHGSVWRA